MPFRSARLLCPIAIAAAALAQQAPPAPPSAPAAKAEAKPEIKPESSEPQNRIRVQVNEVIVPVTVTDDKGRFVSNLDVDDFQVLDEGRPQKVTYFTREGKQPVVVGFLLDMSNSTRLHWAKYQEAAIELVLNLMPGEKKYAGYLVSYGNDAELLVNTTSDSEKLVEKIRKMKPGGAAALFDAIYKSCTTRELVKGEPYEPRRVLVIIGDGHDTASSKSLDEVVEIAQRNLVTIYAMSTKAFGFAADGEKNLTRLAEETGGRVEYPLEGLYSNVSGYLSTPSDEGNYALKVGTGGYASELARGIFNSVAQLTGEVTTQYILRYTPDVEGSVDPKTYRNIKVNIRNLPNVKVRARKGYYPVALGQ